MRGRQQHDRRPAGERPRELSQTTDNKQHRNRLQILAPRRWQTPLRPNKGSARGIRDQALCADLTKQRDTFNIATNSTSIPRQTPRRPVQPMGIKRSRGPERAFKGKDVNMAAAGPQGPSCRPLLTSPPPTPRPSSPVPGNKGPTQSVGLGAK